MTGRESPCLAPGGSSAPALIAVAGLALAGVVTGLAAAPAGAAGRTDRQDHHHPVRHHAVRLRRRPRPRTARRTSRGSATSPAPRACATLHLCVLKTSSKSCVGGVQTTTALGDSSAQDVKVVVSGNKVELVWIAQVDPDSGEFSGVFGTNTVSHGRLGTSVAVPGAPTLGSLTSAIAHKGGGVSLAAVGEVGTLDRRVYYYPTVSATPKTFKRPYFVGNAQLADNGKRPCSPPASTARSPARSPSPRSLPTAPGGPGSTNIAGSYTRGNIEQIVTAGKNIRMVGVSAKAIYTPVHLDVEGQVVRQAEGERRPQRHLHRRRRHRQQWPSRHVDSESGGLMVSNFGKGTKAGTLPVQGQADPRRRPGADLDQGQRPWLPDLGHREAGHHRPDPQGPGDQAPGLAQAPRTTATTTAEAPTPASPAGCSRRAAGPDPDAGCTGVHGDERRPVLGGGRAGGGPIIEACASACWAASRSRGVRRPRRSRARVWVAAGPTSSWRRSPSSRVR